LLEMHEEKLENPVESAGEIQRLEFAVVIHKADSALLVVRPIIRFAGSKLEPFSTSAHGGLLETLRKQLEKETGLALKKDFCYIGHLDYTSKNGRKTRQIKLTTRAIEQPNTLAAHCHY